jgi:hypothetical protein
MYKVNMWCIKVCVGGFGRNCLAIITYIEVWSSKLGNWDKVISFALGATNTQEAAAPWLGWKKDFLITGMGLSVNGLASHVLLISCKV